jgi:hypothetical protein
LVVADNKKASPSWIDVKAALQTFDRVGLLGLVQALYAASDDNQLFLHTRLGLGHDHLRPYKATISRWICPDPMMRNQSVSVSKAKKAIADYKRAIGRPDGLAELSVFYCEEAFSFAEAYGIEDESYFAALVRMYDRSLNLVLSLSAAERPTYVERLNSLRSRAGRLGWGVQDEVNSLWYEMRTSLGLRANDNLLPAPRLTSTTAGTRSRRG